MGFATHLGPWLLGTVKDTSAAVTTGNAALGLIRNVGACPAAQFKTVSNADITANTVLAVLPAGASIQNVQYIVTAAYATTTPSMQIYVNGNAISAATAVSAFTTTGLTAIPLATSNPALVANVGATDAVVSFTQTNVTAGTGAGVFSIAYIVRGSDGSTAPASA
jgi:hypothetical protein